MMGKYNFISNYFTVVIIVLYIGSTVNALVGNICTSEMMDKLDNITTTEVMIKVNENEWELGSKISVKIDVGEEKSIRNIIIWAETVDGKQPGTHIGYWTPISEHVYVDGCNGPANATISNQIDLNIPQITYEWNSPNIQNSEPPKTPITTTPTSSQPSTSSAVPSSSPVQSTSTSTSQSPTTSPSPSPSPTECHDKHDKHDKHHHNHHHNHDLIYDKNILTTIVKLIYPRQEEKMKMSTISMKNQMSYLTYTQASVGSIVFKGVIQLMNHPDDEIYSFESDVIKDNSNDKHMLDDTKVDDNVPKESSSSVANSKFILSSLVLPSILTLIIGILTY